MLDHHCSAQSRDFQDPSPLLTIPPLVALPRLDLSDHLSEPVDPQICARALRIYCLSDSHRRALIAQAPEAEDRIELLRPDGGDIADPYGGDLEVYQQARDEISAAVQARAGDWWP